MTIPSTFSNVIIEGNTIDIGSSSSGGAPTFYQYGTHGIGENGYLLSTSADCRIFGNYFSGIATNNAGTYMIQLSGCSCNIQGNTFIRGSSEVAAYINNVGLDDHIITGNIFDGYTVDGSTPQSTSPLVAGITANTLYTNNKNQVGYAVIPLATDKTALFKADRASSGLSMVFNTNDGNPPDIFTDYGVTAGYLPDPYVLLIYNNMTVPITQNYFFMNIDIGKSIPVGAKIIDAKYSVYNPSSIPLDTSGTNAFYLFLVAGRSAALSIDAKTYDNASSTSSMIGYESDAILNITGGNEPSMRTAYQVLEIPTLNFSGFAGVPGSISSLVNHDISGNYVAGNNYGLTATLQMYWKADGYGTASPLIPLIVVSPLIITYLF